MLSISHTYSQMFTQRNGKNQEKPCLRMSGQYCIQNNSHKQKVPMSAERMNYKLQIYIMEI